MLIEEIDTLKFFIHSIDYCGFNRIVLTCGTCTRTNVYTLLTKGVRRLTTFVTPKRSSNFRNSLVSFLKNPYKNILLGISYPH